MAIARPGCTGVERSGASLGLLMLATLLALLPLPALAADEDDEVAPIATVIDQTAEQELQRLSQALASADEQTRSQACHAFEYSGITDPAAMARIAALVEANLARTVAEGLIPGEQPECVRALASSGDPRYQPLLQRALDLRPERGAGYAFVRRHLQRSVEALPRYPAWNAQINLRETAPSARPWPVTRAMNLLRSPENLLQREGLKRAGALAPRYPELYLALEARLDADLGRPGEDPARIDLDARICRVLAESRDRRYLVILERAAAPAQPKKLQKHAQRALEDLRDAV